VDSFKNDDLLNDEALIDLKTTNRNPLLFNTNEHPEEQSPTPQPTGNSGNKLNSFVTKVP